MIKQRVKGTRGSLIPFGIVIVFGLLFYSIYDLQTTYVKQVGALLGIVYIFILLWLLKYSIISMEYSILGSDIVLKRMILGYVQKVSTVPFKNISAIGYGKKIKRIEQFAPCLDFCASFRGKHFRHMIIIFKEDGRLKKLKFEPRVQMSEYIKIHTTGKFYEY